MRRRSALLELRERGRHRAGRLRIARTLRLTRAAAAATRRAVLLTVATAAGTLRGARRIVVEAHRQFGLARGDGGLKLNPGQPVDVDPL